MKALFKVLEFTLVASLTSKYNFSLVKRKLLNSNI